MFPEGGDPRVREAAFRLAAGRLVTPVLIGGAGVLDAAGVELRDSQTDSNLPAYASLYLQRRGGKGVTEREAQAVVRRPLDFAALMVAAGDADGSVGGAANSTAETVRAALHAIGPAPGIRTVSSFFVMGVPNEQEGCGGLFIAADCAVLIDPEPAQLAEIARMAARSAHMAFECEPVVGVLPGRDPDLGRKVKELIERVEPGLQIRTGDDAFRGVNALVFPDLHAANIGYKMVEWLGGGAAFGPMLQGLARPANDLSRACTSDDVYTVALVTALQAHSVVAA